jgi:hypothetical protein
MKYVVTITPVPYTTVVDTFSGQDVAEEMARQRFRAQIIEGSFPIHFADYSQVQVQEVLMESSPSELPSKKCCCTTVNYHGSGKCVGSDEVAGYCRCCYSRCLPADE